MNQTISMISIHDLDGSVQPYRFKMKDDAREEVIIQVKNIVDKKEESYSGTKYLVYYCSCIINNYKKIFEVRYRKDTCRWCLVNIIE